MKKPPHEEAIEILKEDYRLGVYTEEEFSAELSKLVKENKIDNNYMIVQKKENKELILYRYGDVIKPNIGPIAKMILENKWMQRNVDLNKIVVVSGITSSNLITIYSVTYINKYGKFIKVELSHIVTYLDKIDFDE